MPKSRIKIQRDLVLPRTVNTRDYTLFVIAVEGEKTEKRYFQRFGGQRIKIHILATESGKSSPSHLMERLKTFVKDQDILQEDECWMVFDADGRSNEVLKEICANAREEHFHSAISNPCFEYWLFLHTCDESELAVAVRIAPIEQRARAMKQTYNYNFSTVPVYEFRKDVENAIRRAEAASEHNKQFPTFPGTHVYKVVKRLVSFTR